MSSKKLVATCLDGSELQALDKISKESGDSVSALIRQAVAEFLREESA